MSQSPIDPEHSTLRVCCIHPQPAGQLPHEPRVQVHFSLERHVSVDAGFEAAGHSESGTASPKPPQSTERLTGIVPQPDGQEDQGPTCQLQPEVSSHC